MDVYFISDGCGNVKIGHSVDWLKRLSNLQGSNSRKLKIIRVINSAGPATEKWLHRRYAARKVKGEWFAFSAEMLTVVPPDELPPPSKNTRTLLEQMYDRGEITAQQLHDRQNKLRDEVHADLRSRLPPDLQEFYDRNYR